MLALIIPLEGSLPGATPTPPIHYPPAGVPTPPIYTPPPVVGGGPVVPPPAGTPMPPIYLPPSVALPIAPAPGHPIVIPPPPENKPMPPIVIPPDHVFPPIAVGGLPGGGQWVLVYVPGNGFEWMFVDLGGPK